MQNFSKYGTFKFKDFSRTFKDPMNPVTVSVGWQLHTHTIHDATDLVRSSFDTRNVMDDL